jgi:hypothetical protein
VLGSGLSRLATIGWTTVTMVIGTQSLVASALFANSTIWTGPLTNWVDGGDLSIFAGLLDEQVLTARAAR